MRTSSKWLIVGAAALVAAFLPTIGDAYRTAQEARRIVAEDVSARQAIADALRKAATESPTNQAFASFALFRPEASVEAEDHALLKTHTDLVERRKDMCIAAMIWGEARGEPREGQYMVGYVGHMRAVDKWFGSDNPCVQVCKTGNGSHREFDGTKHFCEQIKAFKNGGKLPSVPEEFIKIAHEVRTGEYQPPAQCKSARYFANFAESSPGGIKYFQKNTKIRCVLPEGDQLFAEDRPQVRKAIAKMRPAMHHAKPVVVAAKSMRHKKQQTTTAALTPG